MTPTGALVPTPMSMSSSGFGLVRTPLQLERRHGNWLGFHFQGLLKNFKTSEYSVGIHIGYALATSG